MKSPVWNVIPVPIEQVQANAYNPNRVAPPEYKLLIKSIREDGYTMPVVCYKHSDEAYELVDGYHRYRVMLECQDIYDREQGLLPVSVIDKDISHRMASTIRHNRSRGEHTVALMKDIVADLIKADMSDAWIRQHLGMDQDELLRMKQLTGLTALFKDADFSQAWEVQT